MCITRSTYAFSPKTSSLHQPIIPHPIGLAKFDDTKQRKPPPLSLSFWCLRLSPNPADAIPRDTIHDDDDFQAKMTARGAVISLKVYGYVR